MSTSIKTRPKSAHLVQTCHQQQSKQYRIQEQQCYNYLRNNIYKTFGTTSTKTYQDIKQLTSKSTSSNRKNNARIDRLCVKYSITPNHSRNKMFNGENIDSQYIAKNYVKQKSNEKQRQVNRERLKQQILLQSSKVNVSSKPKKNQQFFKLTTSNLKNLQRSQSKSQRGIKGRYEDSDDQLQNIPMPSTKRESHPYLKIYEESQNQAFELLLRTNKIEFKIDQNFPQFQQADQWQKYQKSKKQIYIGLKRMRQIYSAKYRKPRQNSSKKEKQFRAQKQIKDRQNRNYNDSFYLT